MTGTSGNLIAEARAIMPAALHLAWWRRALNWGGWALGISLFIAAAQDLGLGMDRLAAGAQGMARLISHMWPPNAAGSESTIIHALAQTLAMAFIGTVSTVLLALPLALIGARTVVSHPVVHFVIRLIFDVTRAIPALIWALVLVTALGMGPRVGVLALVLSETPMVAKIFAEMMENRAKGPIESLRASGASFTQVLRFGLAPQVLPVIAGMSLFLFEANVRTSAAFGVVGAGGIGAELEDRIKLFMLDQVAWIMALLIVVVVLIDTLSQGLRRRLVDSSPPSPTLDADRCLN